MILFYLSHFHSLIFSPNVVTGSLEGQGRVDSDTRDRKAHAEVSIGAALPKASWESEPEFRGKRLGFYLRRQDNRSAPLHRRRIGV